MYVRFLNDLSDLKLACIVLESTHQPAFGLGPQMVTFFISIFSLLLSFLVDSLKLIKLMIERCIVLC